MGLTILCNAEKSAKNNEAPLEKIRTDKGFYEMFQQFRISSFAEMTRPLWENPYRRLRIPLLAGMAQDYELHLQKLQR